MTQEVWIAIQNGPALRGQLTTEHAASSYGQPIMLIDGKAYGPGDRYHRWPLFQVSTQPFRSIAETTIDLNAVLASPPPVEPQIVRLWVSLVCAATLAETE